MVGKRKNEFMTTFRVKVVEQEYLAGKEEVAKFLGGVSIDYVGSLMYSGKLPYSKTGRMVFFKVSDVRSLMESYRVY